MLLVKTVYVYIKIVQPKNTVSAWAVQVVSGLQSPDIDPTGKVGLDGTKYPG